MSYVPDGQPRIPNQIPIPGTRADQPAEDPARRRTRALMRTVAINTVVLVAAILLAYVFPVTDNSDVALTIVLVAAIVCGTHMAVVMLREQKYAQRTRLDDARSSTYGTSAEPTPAPQPASQPYGATQPPAAVTDGAFVLPVEDVFTITGRGTVVTGRVASGSLQVGGTVQVVRNGLVLAETQVSGIEMFRKMTDVATAGENVGLLLDGVSRADVASGDEIIG